MIVLIVDDNPLNLKLLRLTLGAAEVNVVEAADGVEALEKLDAQNVDAVISDILMPRMDGYRLCYEIRRRESLRELPFIVYTSTYTSPADEAVALRVGADRFLRKPCPPSELLAALLEVTQAPPERAVPALPDGEIAVLKEYNEGLVRKLEQKNAELEAARRRLGELIDFAPIGIYQSTPEGTILSCNAAFVSILGYSSDADLLRPGMERQIYFDSAERPVVLQRAERQGPGIEVRYKRQDGTPIWLQVDGRTSKDASGETHHY
jgi:PAS domain S-box-containing protein